MAEQLLVPLDDYLKAGIHIGTKFRTKDMAKFIYKVRPDGLSVLNIQDIDIRLDTATKFMSQYKAEDIILVCRRESGWQGAELFSKLTGIRVFTRRYPPGILTNKQLEDFIEVKLLIVIDPWPDKNAVNDAIKLGVPVIALCDTNNDSKNIDLLVPCNNKGKKSLSLIFWILTRQYLKNQGKIKKDSEFKYKVDDFGGEEL